MFVDSENKRFLPVIAPTGYFATFVEVYYSPFLKLLSMQKFLPCLFIFFLYCGVSEKELREKSARDFQNIPASARPNPLWFWNDTKVEPDELLRQMAMCKETGYGGLSILPFGKGFKPEYLTEAYFDVYRVCMEEARKINMTLWIYDEYGFPSGTAGDINGDGRGRFKERYPEHTNKRLDKKEYIPVANTTFEAELPEGKLMAAVAMDTVSFERIDLATHVSAGKLKWNVPAGNLKIMIFTCVNAGNSIVDYMSPEAADLYIGMTHDEYYKRFADYFGKTVVGTFFDEPTLYYANGRSWTPEFNLKFKDKYGFDPALYYPALWYHIGDETEEARNYLFGFRSELYAEGYTKQVNEWSKNHGILATGHQDNEEIVNAVGTSGDLMKCFKYLDVPGIDKIGGDRPAENFYKIISSAAHNWDHSLVMSETYGAMGNIDWDEIFSVAMDQYAKGINLLIPHAVWYNTDKVVFKPELSLRNPLYADSLKVFTDYLSRLNVLMQNDARWTGDMAVLYPVQSMQSGHYFDGPLGHYGGGVAIPDLDYVDVGVALFDGLGYDFMFLHPDILDERCRVSSNKLILDNNVQHNVFSTLVVPGCKIISLSNLKRVKEFADAGGTVIFTTLMPQKATVRSDNPEVKRLVENLSGKKNVFFVPNPSVDQLKAVLEKLPENFSLKFSGDRLKNIHKVFHGKNLWFFANTDPRAKTVETELSGTYDLELWNPHTGTVKENLPVKHENGTTKFTLHVDGIKSLFVMEK